MLWTQVITGVEVDELTAVRVLGAAAWHERRVRLTLPGTRGTGSSQNKLRQVFLLQDLVQPATNVGGIDRDVFVRQVGSFVADLLDDPLQDRVQAARADVLSREVDLKRDVTKASTPSGVNAKRTPSVANSSTYCFVRACFGSVRMRRKSAFFRSVNSTRIGNRPCNSGIKSDGLDM